MENKNKNNKYYESMWDMFLNIGVLKTVLLIWSIYIPLYVIAMFILNLFIKWNKH